MMDLKNFPYLERQFITYFVIGVGAFFVEFIIFSILIYITRDFSLTILLSQTVSFIAGLLTSFLGNRRITFFSENKVYSYGKRSQILRYILLAVFNLIFTNIVLHILISNFDMNPLYSKLIVMATLVTWNFIIFKKFIFKLNK